RSEAALEAIDEPRAPERACNEDESGSALKGDVPTYHAAVCRAVSMPAKARAHLSTQPNTIAYGRYAEKMFSRSANFARSFSATSMYMRNPSARRRSSAPAAVLDGITLASG